MKLKKFHFENGWFAGWFIQDSKGVNWKICNSPKEAYVWYKNLTAWNY